MPAPKKPTAKKTKAVGKVAPPKRVLSPFRLWADAPDGAAINELCEFLVSNSTGGHLAGFAKSKGFAYVTVLDWIHADKTRSETYTRAREDRADVLADEIVGISDEECTMVRAEKHASAGDERGLTEVVFDATAVARNKLRVDSRKWAASKLKPRTYGDRTTLAGDAENPIAVLTLDSIAADPRSRLTIK